MTSCITWEKYLPKDFVAKPIDKKGTLKFLRSKQVLVTDSHMNQRK